MPELDHFESLFDKKLKLRYPKDAAASEALQQPASAGAFTLHGTQLSRGTSLDVLGHPLQLDASLETSLEILDGETQLSLFPQDAPQSAPPGRPWAGLKISTGLDLATDTALPMGQLAVGLRAGAGGTFFYHHLLPARTKTAKRRPTLSRTVRTSRLPKQLKLDSLEPGECHHWNRAFYFDFGLKAHYGQVFKIAEVIKPFKAFPVEIQTHLAATLSASLGFGIYDSMALRVAREQEGEQWVRLRLERQRKKDLSLGVRLALNADYDFGGTSLLKVLDEALGTSPAQQLLAALEDVRRASEAAADGRWDDIKRTLSDHTTRTLKKFYDDAVDIDAWVDGSPEVERLIQLSGELVNAYDSVGPTVSSWWIDLLDEVHLGKESKLRRKLEEVTAFDLDSLLVDQLATLPLELMEALTGRALDPLMDIIELREVAKQSQSLANEAIQFLDRLASVPGDFVARFHAFTEGTGIAKAVEFLRSFSSTPKLRAALEVRVNQWLQNIVERLVGKAWEQIDPNDLKKIQGFAEELDELLKRLQALPDRLRGALGHLKGEFHLNLSYHFHQATSSNSLIDIVFDPNDIDLRNLMEATLEQRDAGQLLDRLAKLGDEEEPSYEILESVFTWRRTTTGTLSFLSKFLGRFLERKIINQRSVASTTHIEDKARKAIYVGGFERTLLHDSYSFQGGTWLEIAADGPGTRLDEAFERLDSSLELGIARTDHAITKPVINAYHQLLRTLGFLKKGPDIRRLFDERINHQARFSLRLRFSRDAVAALCHDLPEADWQNVYVAAAKRWFRDDFTASLLVGHVGSGDSHQPISKGDILAAAVSRPRIQKSSADQDFKNWILDHKFSLPKDDSQVTILGRELFKPLSSVLWHRDAGFRQFKRLQEQLTSGFREPQALRRLVRRVAKTFQKSCAGGWDNPMFNFWLLLALIDHQTDDGQLSGVRGSAQLSTRDNKMEAWETPISPDGQLAQWRMEDDTFDAWPPILVI